MLFVYRFDVFTSPCELQLFGASKTVCDATAATVLRRSKHLEAKYSFFDPNSFLSSINNRQTNKIKIDAETTDILKNISSLMEATNFVFDIAYAGTLKECYKSSTLGEIQKSRETLLPYASATHYEIGKNKLTFSNPHTKIDLGGVVKEYAIDEAVKSVRQAKIKHALINFGGDISVVGTKPNGEAWKVGIKNPQDPSIDLFAVELADCSMTSSGHYERGVDVQGVRFSHIIKNERTNSSLLQATVMHKSAMTAGVFSTALLIDEKLSLPNNTTARLIDSSLKTVFI